MSRSRRQRCRPTMGQSDLYGAARFQNWLELIAGGWTRKPGLFLGRSRLIDLHHNPAGHVLTVAPPDSGKTTSLVVPNLLTYHHGSLVVTDPKGSLTAMTAAHRRRMGHRVVVLNPWHREYKSETGLDLGSTGFNPLSILAVDENLHDDCRMIAGLMLPPNPRETNPYWGNAGRSVLTGFLLYMALTLPREERTLPRLRSILRFDEDTFKGCLNEMRTLGHPVARDYAGEISRIMAASDQWAGVISKAWEASDIYAEGEPLGEHVSRHEWNAWDLKRRNTTVYIVCPPHRREAAKGWMGLVMALLGEVVGRPGPAFPVLLLAEEFANLGAMPTIYRALAEYREAGLKAWLIVQGIGQLERLYGREGTREIMGLCRTRQVFGVIDPLLSASVSQALGQRTAMRGQGMMPDPFTGQPVGLPLLRPEEVELLPEGQQIILHGNQRPILGRLVPYFRRKAWSRMAGRNPYRQA